MIVRGPSESCCRSADPRDTDTYGVDFSWNPPSQVSRPSAPVEEHAILSNANLATKTESAVKVAIARVEAGWKPCGTNSPQPSRG